VSDLWYYAANEKDARGPFPRTELLQLAKAGIIQRTTLVWNNQMPEWQCFETCFGIAHQEPVSSPRPDRIVGFVAGLGESPQDQANKIANYEIASLVLWGVLAMLQIFIIPGITVTIVGFYNVVMIITRYQYVDWIKKQRSGVINIFGNITPLIIAGIANLVFGACLGVFLTAFDFYIRHLVLQHRAAFTNP
jgi:hypothetical protein